MGMEQQDRRRLLLALAVAAMLAAPVLVRAADERPAGIDRVFTPAVAAPGVATTPCDQVEAPPSGAERDTWYDPETGVVQVWYRVGPADRHFAIDPRNDLTCAQYPEIRALIEHVQDAATDR